MTRGWSLPSRAFPVALVVAGVLGVSACGTSAPRALAPRARSEPTPLYIAVGNGETVGDGTRNPREAWPQVFFRRALPRRWAFVNLGDSGATTADVLNRQVDAAVALGPRLASVAITDDLFGDVATEGSRARLTEIVHRLRRGGATRVLVANVPPLDRQPGYLACLPEPPSGSPSCRLPRPVRSPADLDAAVGTFNELIAGVVSAEGATLVDLHAAGVAARARGEEAAQYAGNDFSPNATGHRAIATAFAIALRQRT